jgi:hypothetical protein
VANDVMADPGAAPPAAAPPPMPAAPGAVAGLAPAAPVAPTPKPDPTSPDYWTSAIQNMAAAQSQKATGNLIAAQGVDPDKAATARALAPVLGIPAAAMEQDPTFWQQQFATQSNRATMGTDANLQKWMAADQGNAKVSQDDVPQLGVIGKAFQAFSQGIGSAYDQQRIGELGFSEQTHTITPQQTDLLQTFKEQAGALGDQQQKGVVPAVGRFLGSTAAMFGNALPEVAAGAAAGAALGLPEGGIGAIPGAIGGAVLGLKAGIAGQTGIETSGQTYDALSDARDKYGKPIPEATKQAASVLAGGVSAALATVGGETLSSPVKALVPGLVKDVAVEMATRPTLNAALGTLATGITKAGVTGAVVNGGMTAAQQLAPQVAEAITSPNFQTVFNDPEQRRQMVSSIVDSMEAGAIAFPAMELPMRGVNLYADMARASAATDSAAKWGALQDGAAASKTRARAPDAFESLMQLHAASGGVDSIFVPADRMAELYQGIQTKPGDAQDPFGFVPDMQAQMERGLLTGGDVEIPTADFTARLAGSDIERQLRPDIRFNPDGFTMREAMDYHENGPPPMDIGDLSDADAGDVGVNERGQAVQAVKDDMVGQLRRAGFTGDDAEQIGTFVAARYGARGDDFAQSPLDMYKAEGIQVQRVGAPTVGPANYNGIDEVIDSLRRGDKQPTDKQLYGPSLLEFLAKPDKSGQPGEVAQRAAAGGIRDESGELAAMDADRHHIGKPGQRKLVNPNGMRLHEAAQRAQEAGYFPDHTEAPDSGELVSAIADELQGNKRYVPPDTGAMKQEQFRSVRDQLDQFLTERGIDIKTASNAEIKTALDGVNKEAALNQSATTGARGMISMGKGHRVIQLFKTADKSTLLHEMGHQFLDELMRDSMREDAPADMVNDANTLRKWMGLADGEMPGVAEHEKFASGFEAYLMEGKAPSLELKLAFQKFAAWLTKIYRTIAGVGGAVSPDVRGVMDRLLATDQAIAEARQSMAMNPVFKNAADAGMTVGEFAAYTGMVRKAAGSQYDRVLRRTMRVERMKATKAYKDAAAEARPEIEHQVRDRPALHAWYALRYGKDVLSPDQEIMAGKLDIGAVKDILGASYAKFPRDLVTAEGGLHPDNLAPAFGYDTGEAMLRDLVNENVGRQEAAAQTGRPVSLNKYISMLTDQAMDAHMAERFGDELSNGSVEDAALAAAHNDTQRDVLAAEMRQLGKLAGQEPPYSIKQVEAWAKSNLADTPIGKAVRVSMYRRAEAQAGRDAERALLAKKPIDAFKAKQRQMIAHAFATEAQRLEGEWNKTTTYWRNVAKVARRDGTAQPYMDQVHGILEKLGMQVKRDPGELARALAPAPLDQFVIDRAAEGYQMIVPAFLTDPKYDTNYKDMTADEFEAARDAVRSILRNGRAVEEITVDGRRVALSDEVDAAQDMMAGRPEVGASDRANPHKAKDVEGFLFNMASGARSLDASLVKIEQFFQGLGAKTSADNPFLRVYDRLKEAQHTENDRREDLAHQWRALKDGLAKDWSKSLRTRIDQTELKEPRTGRAMDMTRGDLIGVMLNMGNDSNFGKLTEGYGWSQENVMSVVAKYARADDIAFVNGVHDVFRSLFPDIEAMHRRVTGVGLGRFDDTPRQLGAGTLKGGYFPVVYDPLRARTEKARMNADGVFDQNYRFASTPKGHTIERTGFVGGIQLGTDHIPYLLSQQVHDLTHREAIMDANKFLSHPAIVQLLKEKAGPEYQRLMTPWLQHIANNSNTDDKSLGWINNMFRKVRMAASAVGIGFRASTLAKHGGSALVNSIGEVGGKELLTASRDLYGPGGAQFRQMVTDKSGELRHRLENIDRDARASFKSLMGESSWIANVERLSYMPVAMADMGSAMPTWLAAYRKNLGEGGDDDAAVAEADRAVRNAHGSSGAADLAAVQRPTGQFSELFKALTMFYGFFDHMYNRGVRQIAISGASGVRNIRAGEYQGARRDFTEVLGRSMWYLVMPALIEQTVAGGVSQAVNDPNTNWFSWGAGAIMNQASASIPILRDFAAHEIEGYPYEASPLEQVFNTASTTASDFARSVGLSDKPVSKRWLEHAMQTAGYATGLPTGQASASAQYLWDVADGDVEPQTISDFMIGLMRGPPKGE